MASHDTSSFHSRMLAGTSRWSATWCGGGQEGRQRTRVSQGVLLLPSGWWWRRVSLSAYLPPTLSSPILRFLPLLWFLGELDHGQGEIKGVLCTKITAERCLNMSPVCSSQDKPWTFFNSFPHNRTPSHRHIHTYLHYIYEFRRESVLTFYSQLDPNYKRTEVNV